LTTTLLAEELAIRRADHDDAAALLHLHRQGFERARGLEAWRWRFVDNPLGSTQVVGAFAPDGRCLASFAGVPLPCLLDGKPTVVQRAGDASVHPMLRRGMAGSNVMVRTAQAFFAEFASGPLCASFGLPVPALLRTLVRFCRFEVIAELLVLVRDLHQPTGGPSPLFCDAGTSVPFGANALAWQWHREIRNAILRDVGYLEWRYERCPDQDYTFVSARSRDGCLRGLAVLRTTPLEDAALAVAEWIVPDDDVEAQRSLLGAVTAWGRARGFRALAMAAPTWSATFRHCQAAHGFQVRPTEHRLGFRSFHSHARQPFLAQHWHFSLGDVDWI